MVDGSSPRFITPHGVNSATPLTPIKKKNTIKMTKQPELMFSVNPRMTSITISNTTLRSFSPDVATGALPSLKPGAFH